jgi:DNA-binding MarR family transcriptional regulator
MSRTPKAKAAPVRRTRQPDSSGGDIKSRETIDAGSLGFLITSTARILGRTLAAALREHGVAPAQWSVLRHLWAEEGLSQRELCALIAIEEATLTRTIDRLVRDKLAVRRRHTTNGRQHAIYLSERGRQLRDVLVPLVQQVNRRAARRIPADFMQALIDDLTMIRTTLEEDIKAEADHAPGKPGRRRAR